MKLWPSRTKHTGSEPIVDLDAIIAEPVWFKFKGKDHKLKPMELDEFLKFSNAQANLLQMLKPSSEENNSVYTAKELAVRYHKVISAVCDTITIDDILAMEQVQIAALYQLVIDLVTGQVPDIEGKKKRQKIPIYESVQRSSLPSAQGNSVGPQKQH